MFFWGKGAYVSILCPCQHRPLLVIFFFKDLIEFLINLPDMLTP